MRTLIVTAGRGPVEVQRFVAALGPALASELKARGLLIEDCVEGQGSVRIAFSGDALVADLIGTHELVDPLRGRGTRRRWFAGVSVVEDVAALGSLDPRDVVVTACRAGGPGGQHVNTTASAVRATHGPTGESVRVSDERSQHANRRVALKRLALRLAAMDAQARTAVTKAGWRSHDRVVRGDAVATWRPGPGGLRCVRRS